MTATVEEIATANTLLIELGIAVCPTGSRVICPTACDQHSDWDFIGVVSDLPGKAADLLTSGWTSGTSLKFDAEGDPIPVASKFVSLKRGSVNLILTDDFEWRDKFMLATRTATKLGLTMKSQRILLFQALLYGNG